MSNNIKAIRIHSADTVGVALRSLSAGEEALGVVLPEEVPLGHKFALCRIQKGDSVVKYGSLIGVAKEEIKPGQWVHSHNLKTALGEILSYEFQPKGSALPAVLGGSFMGYPRPDGKAGVRNEIWVIPTVGCVNSVARNIAARAQSLVGGGLEGIHSFEHPYGCSQLGEDHRNTQKILAGLAQHPNAGGVLIVGLGCESNRIAEFSKLLADELPDRIRYVECQAVEDEYQAAAEILAEMAGELREKKRQPCPLSDLVVGLKCGGSDGLSGITANPLVGAFSDWLIGAGGSTILTEVPEMFGAETILMNRCTDENVFEQTVRLINDFKQYFIDNHQVIYENPSPGNKEGGITTLEEKSLGCTQKSGAAPVADVLGYGEKVQKRGLSLLSAPGNDLVAATALAASGAQIVLFTTGRGTPFGCPVPTVKISSNTALKEAKPGWVDFDAGILAQGADKAQVINAFCEFILETASGKPVKAEKNGMRDLAIFKNGITL